jgi:hypothetical protein
LVEGKLEARLERIFVYRFDNSEVQIELKNLKPISKFSK